jgi:hypothetical protein
VPPGLGTAGVVPAAQVNVGAADNLASAGAEHGVGKAAALGEVLGVTLGVTEVVRRGHLVRPARPANPGKTGEQIAGDQAEPVA